MTDTLPAPAPPASPVPPDPKGADPDDLQRRVDALGEELANYRILRDSWASAMFVLTAIAALLSIAGIGIALNRGGQAATSAPSITAELSEFAITLSSAQVDEPGVIEVHNGGTMAHNFGVRGTALRTDTIDPGKSAELDISNLAPGTYEVYCTLPGHADSGMTAQLVVGSPSSDAPATAGHDAMPMTAAEGAQQDAAMMESMLAFPAATAGLGNQPLEPDVLVDGTLHFELTASIVDWEVSPGNVVQAWAYNGMVPGPRIDVGVGDTVEVQITNELPVGTDIHWHGIDVPNDQDGVSPITQELVASGETYTYRFTTTEAAIGMYHAHAHAQEAVPNGLFGTFYVGDVGAPAATTISGIPVPADLTIAQDIPMVLNDAGAIGLSLNAKSFPATAPVVVDEGDWIRVTYFNEGLQVHPMHLHGFEQLVIAKDGEPLDAPYAADTILIAPGERYTVLVHADAAGTWVWHCHILNHVESDQGMFGMVTALVVRPPES
jgi:uncharacterized cupredoxin-like copper-binding protein